MYTNEVHTCIRTHKHAGMYSYICTCTWLYTYKRALHSYIHTHCTLIINTHNYTHLVAIYIPSNFVNGPAITEHICTNYTHSDNSTFLNLCL